MKKLLKKKSSALATTSSLDGITPEAEENVKNAKKEKKPKKEKVIKEKRVSKKRSEKKSGKVKKSRKTAKKQSLSIELRLKKLTRTLGIAGVLGAACILLTIFLSALESNTLTKQTEIINNLNQFRLGAKQCISDIQLYTITGRGDYHSSYLNEIGHLGTKVVALEKLRKVDLEPEEAERLEELNEFSMELEEYDVTALEYMKAEEDQKVYAQRTVMSTDYINVVTEFTTKTDVLIAMVNTRLKEESAGLKMVRIVFSVLSLVSFCYIIFLVLRLIFFMRNSVVQPIKAVSLHMKQLADGNLHEKIELSGFDATETDTTEVGSMLYSINSMCVNLTDVIEEITFILAQMQDGNFDISIAKDYKGDFSAIKHSFLSIREEMIDTFTQLTTMTNQVGTGSSQLAGAAEDLANGSTIQATQISSLLELMDEMTNNMQANVDEANASIQIAEQTTNLVNVGNEKMESLKISIDDIHKCSEQIDSIIQTIDGIAEQTNLLSLNASIEAAHAGVAGRGFAVVASEINNLANACSKASSDVAILIQQTVKAVKVGISLTDDAANTMYSIVDNSGVMIEKINRVTELLNSNAENIASIKNNVEQISAVVDNTSATSQETAAISEEQKEQVDRMVELVEKFTH